MKSQKGISMISLILYIASFLVITATIASITTFFYGNIEILDSSIGSNGQYNKFNLYMLNECKEDGNILFAWREDNSNQNLSKLDKAVDIGEKFITFKNVVDGTKKSFIYDSVNNDLYYNSIKLCDDVEDFQIKIDESTGKNVIKIFIKIDGTAFTTDYVVKS